MLQLPDVGLPDLFHHLRGHGPVCAGQPGGGSDHASHGRQQEGTGDDAPVLENVLRWGFFK